MIEREINYKGEKMTKAIVTKILKKEALTDGSMSIGFRRYLVLPNNFKSSLGAAYFFKTKKTTGFISYVTEFFGNMTEAEYKTYLLTH